MTDTTNQSDAARAAGQPPVTTGDEAMPSQDPGDDAQRREAAERAASALDGDADDAGASGRE